MDIKRYKNAIRQARANKSYLKFLKLPVDRGIMLLETAELTEDSRQIFALLMCPESDMRTCLAIPKKAQNQTKKVLADRNISDVRLITAGSLEHREFLAKAGSIVVDKALPPYFIKRDGQNIIILCDELMDPGNFLRHSPTDFGHLQRTVLMADELRFAENGKEELFRKQLMVSQFNVRQGADVYYAGNLLRPENRYLINKIIERREGHNLVIAFENEIKPVISEFMNNFGDNVDFLQIMPGGTITFADYIWQNLYKNHGWFKIKADRYYEREYRRLFAGLNIREIGFINTGLYERIEVILKCSCKKVFHNIPKLFYRQLVDVFFRYPERLKTVVSRFDSVTEYDKMFGIESWENMPCSGVYARPERLSLNVNDVNIEMNFRLNIITDEQDAELENLLVIGSTTHEKIFEYPAEKSCINRKEKDGMSMISCVMKADIPCVDIEGWYINNLPMIRLRFREHVISVPLLLPDKTWKKVYSIDAVDKAFVIKEDYRHVRFGIRKQMVTDRTAEKIKLGLAFICALITPWNRPVLLCEKYCMNYEESASVLFEKLVDKGYRKARFVLNGDSPAINDINGKYRKQIIEQFSFAHYYTMFAAGSVISSEAVGHCLEKGSSSWLFRNFVVDGSKNYVFLQHGVMYMVALSSEQRLFFKKARGKGKQRVVVSSRLEADHFISATNYLPEDIYICGLLKFDRSVLNADADRILVMLTWRPWEFVTGMRNMNETAYYRMLHRIVNCVPEELRDRLVVMPHPLVSQQINPDTDDDVWRYYVSGVKYDDLLRKTKLLITDYSSISYDSFYRGSNVIFDWQEKDACMREYGSNGRLMLTEELAFGDVCYNDEELRKSIVKAYEEGQSEKHLSNFSRLVEFNDGNNSDRFIKMARKDGIL
ncbi:MAG: CDP-glycerol glycerophosphotransferase family protein [Eubacteriales bacterium]|nr:CDP-glycerol glycerophosphotransferase family protein [Eubacteriales bacterium]